MRHGEVRRGRVWKVRQVCFGEAGSGGLRHGRQGGSGSGLVGRGRYG